MKFEEKEITYRNKVFTGQESMRLVEITNDTIFFGCDFSDLTINDDHITEQIFVHCRFMLANLTSGTKSRGL